ncbi:MAG: hypothetical protein SLRJCFUN_000882, partial [Candidatus Fervidibacter sp.]
MLAGVMLMSGVVAAFDPPIAKVGDFTMRIDAPQIVTQLETPIPVRIHLENAGNQTLRGKVRLQVIDRWKVVSANPQSFELPAKSERLLEFAVVAGKGTHNAHYPIHAFAEWDGGRGARDERKAHAVLVVEVRAPREPKPPKEPIVRLPERGSVPLWQQGSHQVSFQVFGQPMQTMPKGWWGTDEATGAHATLQKVDRGGMKEAIAIHPPWRKGAGTIFVDWQVSLPKSQPIFLDFAFAIRDHDPQREPPSDGVTVRVWVKRTDAGKTGSREIREAKKSASKPSTKINNPTALGQIGKLLPLQKPAQLFVGSPVSRPNFLSNDQVKGIVVTHTPTQGCIENFLCAPINAATMNGQFRQDFLKGEERSRSHRSSLCKRFYQTAQNFVFKPVGNMGSQLATKNVRNQRTCGQTDFQRFVQQYDSQEDRCVYDDDFLVVALVSHPLANSLCLRKPLKIPLPFTPKWVRNQSTNSSREILPSLSSRIFCLNSLATVRSSTNVSPLFRLATIFHPFFLRLEFLHHPLANSLCFKKLAKMPLPLMPNLDHHHSANSISVISPFLRTSTIRSNSARNSSFVSTFVGDFLFGTSGHLTPQFVRLTKEQVVANRSVHHSSLPSSHALSPSLNCESASNAASMNSQLATPCCLILFSHQSQAASGPFVSFNSFNLRETNSRSLRYLASNSERLGELFAFAIEGHLAQPLCHPVAFDGGGAPTQDGDDGWRLLYERHSDSKVWLPAQVDLSEFAGQQVILRIEVHPGPKNDTTCDLAFIGEPYLVAGRKPPKPTKPKVDERLRLTAITRWRMVQAADKWGLLPKDFQARKQLMALQLLAPIAKTADELKRVNEIATQLLKRIKVSPQQKPLSLFSHSASSPQSLIPSPSSTQPAVWVNLHEGEFFAYALQTPTQSGWW